MVAERVRRVGPIRFEEFMDLALYHPDHGFYARGRGAGRAADFLTSPEVGPLYGAVVARAIDDWWVELGRPDPFTVIEAGAGDGRLARDVLAAGPECSRALRYVLVEQSPVLRAAQGKLVRLEPTGIALGPVEADIDGEEARRVRGVGPLAASLGEFPAEPVVGVVFANELLDNLAVRVLERTSSGWSEVFVTDEMAETLVLASPDALAVAGRYAPDAPVGARIPIQQHAAAWVRDAMGLLERGRVVVVDYARTTAEMAALPWTQWLRTYAGHGRGDHPLERPGAQDITCDVAVDQLTTPTEDRTQAEFLSAHGLDELTDAARAEWQAGAATGGLEALKARSRVTEAAALSDPQGLGAFRVLEWKIEPRGRPRRGR